MLRKTNNLYTAGGDPPTATMDLFKKENSTKGCYYMRKCLRCGIPMVEDLNIMVTNGGYGVEVREKGMFKGSLGKIKCAVCPDCGYTETYIDNTENIKKLAEKNK